MSATNIIIDIFERPEIYIVYKDNKIRKTKNIQTSSEISKNKTNKTLPKPSIDFD